MKERFVAQVIRSLQVDHVHRFDLAVSQLDIHNQGNLFYRRNALFYQAEICAAQQIVRGAQQLRSQTVPKRCVRAHTVISLVWSPASAGLRVTREAMRLHTSGITLRVQLIGR